MPALVGWLAQWIAWSVDCETVAAFWLILLSVAIHGADLALGMGTASTKYGMRLSMHRKSAFDRNQCVGAAWVKTGFGTGQIPSMKAKTTTLRASWEERMTGEFRPENHSVTIQN